MTNTFWTSLPLAQAADVSSVVTRLDSEFVFVLLLVGSVFGFVTLMVVSTLAMKLYQRHRESKMASDLIHDMLARQMSVEQIVMVLDSWNGRSPGHRFVKELFGSHSGAPAKPPKAMKMPA